MSGRPSLCRAAMNQAHIMEKNSGRKRALRRAASITFPPGRGWCSVDHGRRAGAYTLTDRGTFAAYKSKTGLDILVAGDLAWPIPYGIIAVQSCAAQGHQHQTGACFVRTG